MKRTSGSNADPMERQIERALCPGQFIGDRTCFSFVRGLKKIAADIQKLSSAEPARSVKLCEAFLAGCHAKAERLDDSSGNFGMFVKDLICLWIKARQADGADADQTAATLLRWMDDDPYAFCYEIENDTSAAFDEVGRSAFEKQVRARFEAVSGDSDSWPYRRLSAVLRAIYLAQGNILAYVQLAERTGLTPTDCVAAAKLLAAQKPADGLRWVERGRALEREKQLPSGAGYHLDNLHRDLLTKLGRGDEALQAAWADFRQHPSKYSYNDLMKFVPKIERAEWHQKAMNAATDAGLHSVIELLVESNEVERLADLVRGAAGGTLEAVGHYVMEPAAKKLERSHPVLAARLWRAQGMRILDAKKSKYYGAALSNFERARDCYVRAGLPVEWEETVRQVSAAHFRKTGFIGEFQKLAAGAKRGDRPSFLESAQQREKIGCEPTAAHVRRLGNAK